MNPELSPSKSSRNNGEPGPPKTSTHSPAWKESRNESKPAHSKASSHYASKNGSPKKKHSTNSMDSDSYSSIQLNLPSNMKQSDCIQLAACDVNGTDVDGFDNNSIYTVVGTSPATSSKRKRHKYRTKLPVPMFSRNEFSVWSILKQCIGKELSKITMPLVFNEPLSFLQRIAEYMEYSELLTKACDAPTPVERMQYVAAFAVSAISSNWERVGKPFNPLLGETFELNRPDLGFRLVSEQVSHHPPVSAFHVESEKYKFSGSINPKLKFWGKSVEVNPKGLMTLEILKYNEIYTWTNVNCCVHNVVVGKLWVEHYGLMDIQNQTNKLRCALNFKQGGWFGSNLHKLDGYIYSPEKKKLKALYGSWIGGLYAVDVDKYDTLTRSSTKIETSRSFTKPNDESAKPKPIRCHSSESLDDEDMTDDIPCTEFPYNLSISGQQLLWNVSKRPSQSSQYFNFTHFAMMLNEFTPGHADELPPTDVRFRPDIRLMENGDIDGGAAEKNRIEEKQRNNRKDRKKSHLSFTPLWFSHYVNPYTNKDDWKFNNKYFNRNWLESPNIF